MEPRPAATVILLRDGPEGPETFMLKRSHRAGFFPHAWVFPGGRLDAADARVATAGAVPHMDPVLVPFAVCALRECLEETGVWLGRGEPPADLRARLNARTATLLDAPGLVPDLSHLRYWAWWLTPEPEPKRFDTHFFLAAVPREQTAEHDEVELVRSAWIRPADALARNNGTDFFMAPPTYRTLEELSGFSSVQGAMAAERDIVQICPVIHQGEEGWHMLLPADPEHPAPYHPGPKRIIFQGGGWRSAW